MSERASRGFLVATANDISSLPPELMRKGRFDEILFVDLPDADTRKDILRIHIARRDLEAEAFDLDHIANATEGFSGAELEQAVVASLYEAYSDRGVLTTEHLLARPRQPARCQWSWPTEDRPG